MINKSLYEILEFTAKQNGAFRDLKTLLQRCKYYRVSLVQ